MTNQTSFLDQLAIQWKEEHDSFFLDCPFSNDYVQVEISDTKNHTWPIEDHDIGKSKNLVAIFDRQYRNSNHPGFVPLFDMISEMFGVGSFPPPELDLGTITVFDDLELMDVLSGIEGNFGNSGWVISQGLLNVLSRYNIGRFQAYSVTLRHRNQVLPGYSYLHFQNNADEYVDFSNSSFYLQKGSSLEIGNRTVISAGSLQEMEEIENNKNATLEPADWSNYFSIHPKELFLSKNDLDLFRFDGLSTTDVFMSARLAAHICKENISGFDLKKTTKVKMLRG